MKNFFENNFRYVTIAANIAAIAFAFANLHALKPLPAIMSVPTLLIFELMWAFLISASALQYEDKAQFALTYTGFCLTSIPARLSLVNLIRVFDFSPYLSYAIIATAIILSVIPQIFIWVSYYNNFHKWSNQLAKSKGE